MWLTRHRDTDTHTQRQIDRQTHTRTCPLSPSYYTHLLYIKAVVATNSIIYCGEQVHFCSQVGSGQFVTMRRYEKRYNKP